ncbi:hypothetical protein [Streptomyces sp. NPDC005408]|uniref:hypothetical protein n=1 Tax=Streptomyces sp. NPDC005408 TaxID=3155341 RepID=UPI00339F4A5B
MTAFLWESVKGHVCLGESELSGGLRAVKCSETRGVKPKGDSTLAALFGPGTLNEGARVVMVADPGEKVVSVKYQKQKMDWKFIRTLSPATSGRDVYYVTLPDFPDDWLNVAVRVGGQEKADRLWLGW